MKVISQVLIYFCMDYITLLTPLSTANRARPHSSKHNLSYRRCSSTGRAFWLHHCSFQTCVKFQGARRFTSYVRQQILTARRPPLPPPPPLFSYTNTIDLQLQRLLLSSTPQPGLIVPFKGSRQWPGRGRRIRL